MPRRREWFVEPAGNVEFANQVLVANLRCKDSQEEHTINRKSVFVYPCSEEEYKMLKASMAQKGFDFKAWTRVEGERLLRAFDMKVKKVRQRDVVRKLIRDTRIANERAAK